MALTIHTSSSAEVKEKVEVYLNSRSGRSWLFLGWALPFMILGILCVSTNNKIILFFEHLGFQSRLFKRILSALFLSVALQPKFGLDLLTVEASRSHTHTQPVGLF